MENVGIVTTWFERGAAYVSKLYYEALKKDFNVFIFARGAENAGKGDTKWDKPYVTWGYIYGNYFHINKHQFFKWIETNKIGIIFFNEQHDYEIVADVKKKYPKIKIGAYVDYYTESTIPLFNLYDFVICNTKRHMEAMKNHKQAIYIKWGTDLSVYKPSTIRPIDKNNNVVTFFHSVGMSPRKGTDILTETFISHKLYEKSKLIIHTQIPIENVCKYSKSELEQYGIQVIQKTVSAPSLYYLGDIYVYPTRLDGLGLTMYEALASGLPVITTDYPPMNEVIDSSCGKLVKVSDHYCRNDAYYWPMSICDEDDLYNKMSYYISNPFEVKKEQKKARQKAISMFDINSSKTQIVQAFRNSKCFPLDINAYNATKQNHRKEEMSTLYYFKYNNRLLWKISKFKQIKRK